MSERFTKGMARNIYYGGSVFFFLIFLALTYHTTKVMPERDHRENITEAVVAGKHLWESNNCMGCHTILGEGAYYAPKLTKVVERRGPGYIKSVLMAKEWAPNGRKMVGYQMTNQEAEDMVAFFTWIGEMDLNGFPAKPKYKIEKID